MPTKEEMLQEIYKEIANKELSFGCLIDRDAGYPEVFISHFYETSSILVRRDDIDFMPFEVPRELEQNWKIIGHPVMIGDVLAHFDKSIWIYEDMLHIDMEGHTKDLSPLFNERKEKRKPIDDQPIECIQFVHSLLPNKE